MDNLYVADDKGHEKLLNEIRKLENTNYNLRTLVWVNFPMAYTQVSYNCIDFFILVSLTWLDD